MEEKFYKLARPDGWDFYTGGTINYRKNIGKTVRCPQFNREGRLCSDAFIHASKHPNDCFIGARIPCSAFLVQGVPIKKDTSKCGFEELYITEELEPSKLFDWNYVEAINPINPLQIIRPKGISPEELQLVDRWISVRNSMGAHPLGVSVRDAVWDSVEASIWAPVRGSVWASVWDSVGASVWVSVRDAVRDAVWDSVEASIWAYVGSLFPLTRSQWKYTEKIKTGGYPFQPAVDLWKRGLVLSFNDKIWRLYGGEKAEVLWEGITKQI